MNQAGTLIDRAVAIGRRAVATPERALVAGALLGLLATIDVVWRADRFGDNLPVALLLALSATVPLAIARTHNLAVAVTVTVATSLTLVAYQQLTGAALVSQLIVSAMVAATGLGWARQVRSQVAERDLSSRAVTDTLLEHAARGERARIARELHDVVAHHISMIAVQAETARLTTPGMPTDGAKRLLAIGDAARTALTEMRRLLGVLRDDAGAEVTRRPQPGLHQLNELIDDARDSAGTSIRLLVHGRVVLLDPGVELTAYRIVQEALTNARRHAPGAAVDVELRYTDTALRVRVRDNGPGPPADPRTGGRAGAPDAGHGLLGMRERTATLGGTLSTGPAPASGFLVEAVLPTAAGYEVPTARATG